MKVQQVQKTAIEWIGYEPEGGMLQVEYSDHSVCRYMNVPVWIFHDLLASRAQEMFLNRHIKKRFRMMRVC